MSMSTITFKDLNGKRPNEIIFLRSVDNEPNGITITFAAGHDENTRGPRRYRAQLWPGAGNGHWECAGHEEGDLEKVTRKNLGKEIVVEGIWVEAGERRGFEVYFLES